MLEQRAHTRVEPTLVNYLTFLLVMGKYEIQDRRLATRFRIVPCCRALFRWHGRRAGENRA